MTAVGCEAPDEFFDGEARGDDATAFRQHLAVCGPLRAEATWPETSAVTDPKPSSPGDL